MCSKQVSPWWLTALRTWNIPHILRVGLQPANTASSLPGQWHCLTCWVAWNVPRPQPLLHEDARCVNRSHHISAVPAFQPNRKQLIRHGDPWSCVSTMICLQSACGLCALRYAEDQFLDSSIQQSPFCTCKCMYSCADFSTVARVEAIRKQGVVPGVNTSHPSGLA